MLAGHMMNNVLFGHRHHTYHRNPEEGQSSPQGNGRQIIIVNNGQQEGVLHNETTISGESSAVVPPENPLTEEDDVEGQGEGDGGSEAVSSEESTESEATPQPYPDGGIICFPIMLNETPADATWLWLWIVSGPRQWNVLRQCPGPASGSGLLCPTTRRNVSRNR